MSTNTPSHYYHAKTYPASYARNHAAVQVQRVVRGWLERRRVKEARARKLYEEQEGEYPQALAAVLVIQRAWRSYSSKMLLREKRAEFRRKQRDQGIRRKKAKGPSQVPLFRRRVEVPPGAKGFAWALWNSAALSIQAAYRGHLARDRVCAILQDRAEELRELQRKKSGELKYVELRESEMHEFYGRKHLIDTELRERQKLADLGGQASQWEFNKQMVLRGKSALQELEKITRDKVILDADTRGVQVVEQWTRGSIALASALDLKPIVAQERADKAKLDAYFTTIHNETEKLLLEDAVQRQELVFHEMGERDTIARQVDPHAIGRYKIMWDYEQGVKHLEGKVVADFNDIMNQESKWRQRWTENPAYAATLEAAISVDTNETRVRQVLLQTESQHYESLERAFFNSYLAAIRLEHENEEAFHRKRYVLDLEGATRAQLVLDFEEDMLKLTNTVTLIQYVQFAEVLQRKEQRDRIEIEQAEKIDFIKSTSTEAGKRIKLLLWNFEEQFSLISKDIMREEDAEWQWMLESLGLVLWQDRCYHNEQMDRRQIMQVKIREHTEILAWFHSGLNQVAEIERGKRKEIAVALQNEAKAKAEAGREMGQCSFWEMRGRWDVENEQNREWEELLISESYGWEAVKRASIASRERKVAEMAKLGFPLHDIPAPPAAHERTIPLRNISTPLNQRVEREGLYKASPSGFGGHSPSPIRGPPFMDSTMNTTMQSRMNTTASSMMEQTLGHDSTLVERSAIMDHFKTPAGLLDLDDAPVEVEGQDDPRNLRLDQLVDKGMVSATLQAQEVMGRTEIAEERMKTFDQLTELILPEYSKRLKQSGKEIGRMARMHIQNMECDARQAIDDAMEQGTGQLRYMLSAQAQHERKKDEAMGRAAVVKEEAIERSRSPFSEELQPLINVSHDLLMRVSEEKNNLFRTGLDGSFLITETFGTIAGQMKAYAMLRRDEHLAWHQLMKAGRDHERVIVLDVLWKEHHGRVALCIEEEENWHRMMFQSTQGLHQAMKSQNCLDFERQEAKDRKQLEREEWMLFHHLGREFGDMQAFRDLCHLVTREETTREMLEEAENHALEGVYNHCNLYLERHHVLDRQAFSKDESVVRRRMELEMGRRLEDLEIYFGEQGSLAEMKAKNRSVLKLQSWARGEQGRSHVRYLRNLSANASKAIAIQKIWRGCLGKAKSERKRAKVQKRLAFAQKQTEFEAIERHEMEENEKLCALIELKHQRITSTLLSEELTARRDVERLERRWRQDMGISEFNTRLELVSAERKRNMFKESKHTKTAPRDPWPKNPTRPWGMAPPPEGSTAMYGLPRPHKGLLLHNMDGSQDGVEGGVVLDDHVSEQQSVNDLSDEEEVGGALLNKHKKVLMLRAEEERQRREKERKEMLEHNTELCGTLVKMMHDNFHMDKKWEMKLLGLKDEEHRLPSITSPPKTSKYFSSLPTAETFLTSKLTQKSPNLAQQRGLAPLPGKATSGPRRPSAATRHHDFKGYALKAPLAGYQGEMDAVKYNADYLRAKDEMYAIQQMD